MHDKYTVIGPNGEALTRLNERLAVRQNVSDEQLEALKTSHQLRHMLFEGARASLNEPLKLKMLAAVFEELEMQQQLLWNFTPNRSYCRFFDFPGCSCPKMDNAERLGVDWKITVENCPIHGAQHAKV